MFPKHFFCDRLKLLLHVRSTIYTLLVISVGGCATFENIDKIKHHYGNVEVKLVVSPDSGKHIEWRSAPDYGGSIPADTPCEYLVFSSRKTLRALPTDWSRLVNFQSDSISELIQNTSAQSDKLKCYRVVYAQVNCRHNSLCSGDHHINVANINGELLSTTPLQTRKSVPAREWPLLTLVAIVEVPVVIVLVSAAAIYVLANLPVIFAEELRKQAVSPTTSK